MKKKMKKFADGGEMMDDNETKSGAYVGSRLNMGKLYDKSVGARAEEALNEGKPTFKDKVKTDINNSVQLYKQGLGMKSEPLKNVNYKKGGAVKSASARADGCAIRGKTRA
jgi:hypothetical protein